MHFDQASLRRLYQRGLRNMRMGDLLHVVRRSKSLRRLMNGPLAEMGAETGQLLHLVKDYTSGTYRGVPKTTIFSAVFALLYILNPFDLMPDFLPGIGYLDDMSMLALVIGSVRHDVEKYRRWRRSRAAIARRLRLTFGTRTRRALVD